MKRVELLVALLLAVPNAAAAQPERADVIAAVGLESDARGPAVDDATQAAATPPAPSGVRRFVTDVGGDYKHFISWSTAKWLGAGGLAALAVHPADEPIQQDVLGSAAPVLPGGNVYGSQLFQVPLAAAWWMIAHAAGGERESAAGRDLLRAQISVFSWTYAIRYATDRTRPNGDPRSFPSGHASTSFATAMVLQEHYGWKLGVPAFAAAAYTAASRITANQHWLSDVVFGAALGMVSGRTVTMHVRRTRVTLDPVILPNGGALLFTSLK